MPKLELKDSGMDIMLKMGEGNPGAINVLMTLMGDQSLKIDPDNLMGGLGTILFLDTLGIYGSNIYLLWNDCCDRNLPAMLTVLRACQLGILPQQEVHSSIEGKFGRGTNLRTKCDELIKKVQEIIPNFNGGNEIKWETEN